MNLRTLLFPLATVALLLTVAAKAPPGVVTVEVKEKQETITLTRGQELKIVLPTTDANYAWEIAANDLRFLKQTVKFTPVSTEPTSGTAITFLAHNRLGRTKLSFVYVKPGTAQAVTPKDKRDIVVTVK